MEVGLRMKQAPDMRAQIIGYSHPDEKSHPGLNSGDVAEERAQSVKNYLVTRQGIDPARMTTAGEKSEAHGQTAVLTLVQQ
jgi:outer membrane protein OmpA-like peptidoglycan-associated protein